MPNKIDITGKKYGRLTPINYMGESMWRCSCECGNTTYVTSYAIIHGRTKSCGCLLSEVVRKKNLKAWGEASFSNIYLSYKASAKGRGLPFNLSSEFVKDLVGKPCFYCGRPPSNIKKSPFNSGDYIYSGIDRVDPARGYEADNVVPCCWKCNEAKKKMQKKDFIEWVVSVYKHLEKVGEIS